MNEKVISSHGYSRTGRIKLRVRNFLYVIMFVAYSTYTIVIGKFLIFLCKIVYFYHSLGR